MFFALRTLAAKLTLTFWVLAFLLAAAQCFLLTSLWQRGLADLSQQFNNDLADTIASELAPYYESGFEEHDLRVAMHRIGTLNPRISIYFIDTNGVVRFAQSKVAVEEYPQIDTKPLLDFIQVKENRRFPIYLENPEFHKRPAVFSTSEIQVAQERMFLVIILHNRSFLSGQTGIEDQYIIVGGIITSLFLCVIMGLFGTFLFRKITRRFGSMVEEVSDIASGEFETKVSEEGSDEVASLGKAINQMSAKIIGSLHEIEQVDRERREMVAMVVHDLGSPLAAIRGWLELLLSSESEISLEERHQQLQKIYANVERLSNMIKELFELSKLDANKTEIQMDVFNLAEMIEEDIIPRFHDIAEAKGVAIRTEFSGEIFVKANSELVDKVMKNLIENAIRHNRQGGDLCIRIVPRNPELFQIEVEDSGPGISSEDLLKIFQRFYRGQGSESRHTGGGGLGLAIVKRALELQGQSIQVESQRTRGAKFLFTLPQALDD